MSFSLPPATAHATPTEALAGLVERVTYHNDETGFCVLRVKTRGQRDLVTVVGHAASIGAGEWVQMSGSWVNDRTHGEQFKAGFLGQCARDAGGHREIPRLGDGGFRLHDADGQPLAYIYSEERRRGANDSGLSLEEARRVATWIARSPELAARRRANGSRRA
jgi:hypothetical protein